MYYPNDVDATIHIGSIGTVTLVKREAIDEKIVFRQLSLTEKRENRSKTIDHFEYLLPISDNDNCETDTIQPTTFHHNLFDLIAHINHERYITIHGGYVRDSDIGVDLIDEAIRWFHRIWKDWLILSRNGGSCCSIFCMCRILLDQLKREHAVDIFQSVRALQRQRPAMISSLVSWLSDEKGSDSSRLDFLGTISIPLRNDRWLSGRIPWSHC